MKRVVALLFFLFTLHSSFAQNAEVVFKSNHSFNLSINKKKQFEGYKRTIKITGLNYKQLYQAEIEFKNDSGLTQKLFLLNDGFIHYYRITQKTINFTKAEPSIGSTDNTPSITYISGIKMVVKDTIPDSLPADTGIIIPFENYYQLENYSGHIGCPFPIKEEALNQVIDVVNQEDLEESKFEKAKTAIQEMDSACVLIEQTKSLLQLFEYEETRLSFAKFMYIYTFDLDNYFELYELFNFENSKEELKNYVGMQIDKSTKTKNE